MLTDLYFCAALAAGSAAGYYYNHTDLVARAHTHGLQLHPYTFR